MANRVIIILLIALSVVIFWASLKLGTGSFRSPNLGLMPLLLSILLFILTSLALLHDIFRSHPVSADKNTLTTQGKFRNPTILIVGFCCYALFLDALGFIISTSLLLFLMFILGSTRRWFAYTILAVAMANLSYFIFGRLLMVPLPTGLFSF